ncbi:SusE domain-containing protein [Pseudochryseolinea flava]|uniref:SusE outer membrane protein domain-containing protein n=1 Tax=Pseudochryseolinea flava TaxID=2059302 RepID=A0A364XZU9_9BACT|nr:SusE domain-containing protein [Pseudochryseolinea flava]RAV99166.1 hypothetical protein DQQ10_19900 [Pseudochryseolinea flava]
MKYLSIFFMLLVLCACEKDETKAVLSPNSTPATITSQANGFEKEITPETLAESLEFTWNEANYGVETQVTYTVEIGTTDAFENPTVVGTSNTNKLAVLLGDLNTKLLNDLELPANETSSLQLRVVASIGGKYALQSNPVGIKIKTYKAEDAKPASLWLPGGYQGWNPATAPVIYSIGGDEFEGYVYIKEGTGFKFTSDPDWVHTNYGYAGVTGKLTTDGAADGMSIQTEGYYRLKANIAELTYEIQLVSTWGMIGTATPNNWDASTPMTYNKDTDEWTATLDLKAGALKFRANNDWGLNYGPENSNLLTGKLIHTDGAISISEDGNYTVVLDFSRAVAPYEYAYKVTKN